MKFDVGLAHFLSSEMCIDVNSLELALSEHEANKCSQALFKVVEDFHKALSEKDPESEIIKVYQSCRVPLGFREARIALDSLHHAFKVFACGGLLDLYKFQENEGWYPKIVIDRELLPNDISTLDEMVTIYRGCNAVELANEVYGQAWTTSLEIANLFAHSHYSQEILFSAKDRLVLKAMIPRLGIYYSDQRVEHEIVVDTRRLISVERYVA